MKYKWSFENGNRRECKKSDDEYCAISSVLQMYCQIDLLMEKIIKAVNKVEYVTSNYQIREIIKVSLIVNL